MPVFFLPRGAEARIRVTLISRGAPGKVPSADAGGGDRSRRWRGPGRLMAELAYAAGLRLSGTLRPVRRTWIWSGCSLCSSARAARASLPHDSAETGACVEGAPRVSRSGLHAKDFAKRWRMPGVELLEALEGSAEGGREVHLVLVPALAQSGPRDHRAGIVRRHHVLDVTFQKAIREAVERTASTSVSPHTSAAQFRDAPAGERRRHPRRSGDSVMRTYPQRKSTQADGQVYRHRRV